MSGITSPLPPQSSPTSTGTSSRPQQHRGDTPSSNLTNNPPSFTTPTSRPGMESTPLHSSTGRSLLSNKRPYAPSPTSSVQSGPVGGVGSTILEDTTESSLVDDMDRMIADAFGIATDDLNREGMVNPSISGNIGPSGFDFSVNADDGYDTTQQAWEHDPNIQWG